MIRVFHAQFICWMLNLSNEIGMLKVVALGNILRGDDGIGIVVLDELKKEEMPGIQLLDIGADAFSLLEHFMGSDPIIIIDCARMNKLPGEVVKFQIDQANLSRADDIVSLHGFSLAETYQMAQKMGDVAECHIIGIEPKIVDFNATISSVVKNSIPLIINMVKEEVQKYESKGHNN
jgi:hydrogenase maturation protease